VEQHKLWHVIGAQLGWVHFPAGNGEPAHSGPQVGAQLQSAYTDYLKHWEHVYTMKMNQDRRKEAVAAYQNPGAGPSVVPGMQAQQLQQQSIPPQGMQQPQIPSQQRPQPPAGYPFMQNPAMIQQQQFTEARMRNMQQQQQQQMQQQMQQMQPMQPGQPPAAAGNQHLNLRPNLPPHLYLQFVNHPPEELRKRGLPENIISYIDGLRPTVQKAMDKQRQQMQQQGQQVQVQQQGQQGQQVQVQQQQQHQRQQQANQQQQQLQQQAAANQMLNRVPSMHPQMNPQAPQVPAQGQFPPQQQPGLMGQMSGQPQIQQQGQPQPTGHPSTMLPVTSLPLKDGRVIRPDEATMARAAEVIKKLVAEFNAQREAPIMLVYNMANRVGRGDSLTMSARSQPTSHVIPEHERPLYHQRISQLKADVLELEKNLAVWFGRFQDPEIVRELIAIVSFFFLF